MEQTAGSVHALPPSAVSENAPNEKDRVSLAAPPP
jgi:hypothetical protein